MYEWQQTAKFWQKFAVLPSFGTNDVNGGCVQVLPNEHGIHSNT